MKLHAPKHTEYRKHIYEGKTLCHRTGWIANGKHRVTCDHCLRKLNRDGAEATLSVLEHLE